MNINKIVVIAPISEPIFMNRNISIAGIKITDKLEIPFIVWLSDDTKTLKNNEVLYQHNVFHSILDFLAIESPIYDENMSIFKK